MKTWIFFLLALWSLSSLDVVTSSSHQADSDSRPHARQAEVESASPEPDTVDIQTSGGGGGGGGGGTPTCTVTDTQADSTIAYLFTNGNSGRTAPENLQQLPAYCSDTRNKLTIVKQYQSKQCLPSSQIQICLEAWNSQVDSLANSLCRVPSNNQPTKEQARFFGAGTCGNAVKTGFQQCIKNKICEINEAAKIRDTRKRLATICCNLDSFGDCFHTVCANGPKPKCSVQRADDLLAFYNQFRACWYNCLCGDFTPLSDSCKPFVKVSGPSPPGRSLTSRTGGGGGSTDCSKPYKSIVGALIGALRTVQVPNLAKRTAETIQRCH